MRCPVCVEEGVRSKLFFRGASSTLLAGRDEVFFDGDGKLHKHDVNEKTVTFKCSNQHYVEVKGYAHLCCATRARLVVTVGGVAREIYSGNSLYDIAFEGSDWKECLR